ncbi:uncharacterized protein LOC114361684 [Ostrinia furnacalis]|uniref:uncharacterized protein LOC114361684 n=1 Tax=Ostrinia furnacalis TaxID=93504 RepID=UPI00103FC646|nr:uncharacterized protein LOC114361684 [Ostrinia furnacalis]
MAIEHLKQRFGREDLLIEVYIRELLNLILSQAKHEYELPLSSLYDQLTTQLRALETMGLTSDKYALLLFPLVESALPSDTLKAWERSRTGTLAYQGNNLNNLLSFLKHEVESNQRIVLARSAFNKSDVLDSISKEDAVPTTSCFVSNEQKSAKSKENCIWCDKDSHISAHCAKAVTLSLDDRRKHIKKVKGCSNCLRLGHSSFKCRAFIKCVACHRRHNVLFCTEINKHIPKHSEQESKPKRDSQLSTSHFKSVTLLQTLLIKIIVDSKEVTVRALIDSGAQRSYIKRSLAQNLNLTPVRQEELGHVVFGGLETKKEMHAMYNITVSNLQGSFKIPMEVLDEDRICGYLPRAHDRALLEQLRALDISLTDVGHDIPEISLLIGAITVDCC